LAIGALKMDGSFASNRVGVLDLIGAQGMKAILRLTNTGPEVESLTEEKFATYAALIQQVRSHPALLAIAVSDESDNSVGSNNTRLNNYKRLVTMVRDAGIQSINISNGKYADNDWESIAYLSAGDDVVMFSASTGTTAAQRMTKSLSMTGGKVGVFIPSWRSPSNNVLAASVNDIVAVAQSLDMAGGRAAYIGAWAYKSPVGFESFIGIGDDPVIEANVVSAFQALDSASAGAPVVQFVRGALTIGEDCGASPYCIPLVIDRAPSSNITVTVNLTGGSSGNIGGWTTGTVVFPAGSIEPRCLQVTQRPNNSATGAFANLVFSIQSGSGYAIGTNGVYTLSVVDDDGSLTNYPPCALPNYLIAPVCGSGQVAVYDPQPSIVSHTLPAGSTVALGAQGGTITLGVSGVKQAGVYQVVIGGKNGIQQIVPVVIWGVSAASCGPCPTPQIAYPTAIYQDGQAFALAPSVWTNVTGASASGLPAWATFNAVTGVIGGTALAGTYAITITATNSCGGATATLTLSVNSPCVLPTMPTIGTQSALVGQAVSVAATASGNSPINYAVSGPNGATVAISQAGIVTAVFPAAGTYTVTVTAENTCGSVVKDITFVVAAAVGCTEGFVENSAMLASGGCTYLQYQSGSQIQEFTSACAWMTITVESRVETSPGCWTHTIKVCGSSPLGEAVNCSICPV